MKHVSPHELAEPRPAGQVRTVAIVIYATLALLAVAIPQSLVNWLGDMNGNAVQETLLRGAAALQRASDASGISAPYQRARDLFIALSGAQDD
ncbi:MAG TPA: hypothetical protein VMR17_22485 [Xanthobacteraceae bacterium]|nr:hypothetical protein [Xanthobacteraceae bacterium]